MSEKLSLYERLGGREAVNFCVDTFYEKVIADDRINGLFEGVDMTRQRGMMKMYMCYAFGGAPGFSGRSMREAHAHLNLTEEHFNAVAENFVATLKEVGVEQGLIDECIAIVATTHDDVLNL